MFKTLDRWLDTMSVAQYVPLLRFPILFGIWGLIGYNYKLYMALSVPGFVLSLLFFLFSILVTIGFKTRTSMLFLGLTVLAHGYLFLQYGSLILGPIPVLASLLPIGRYYSLDRYLSVRKEGVVLVEPPTPPSNKLPIFFKVFFIAAALFTIGGPAYNQIFNNHYRLFRSWVMFQSIGKNLVNADFFTVDGSRENRVDYLKVLGREGAIVGVGRHENRKFKPDMRIVGEKNLNLVISRMCRSVDHPDALRVRARIATVKAGWRSLYDGSEPVCSTHNAEVQP